jgi:hypothetical protein
MKPSEVRYYLHNLDGLKQEIADINADLEQYRAMSTDHFRVNMDPDPYRDKPKGTQYFPPEPGEPFSNTMVRPTGGHFNSNSQVESLAVNRVSYIERLETELFRKKNMLLSIKCVIYYLEPIDKRIIELRYTKHMKWYKVAREVNLDEDYAKERDGKVVGNIIKNYNVRIKKTHEIPIPLDNTPCYNNSMRF